MEAYGYRIAAISLGAGLGSLLITSVASITYYYMKLRNEKSRRERAEMELQSLRVTSAALSAQQMMDNNTNGGGNKYYPRNSSSATYMHPAVPITPQYPPTELPTAPQYQEMENARGPRMD